jgi:hypothetical protein
MPSFRPPFFKITACRTAAPLFSKKKKLYGFLYVFFLQYDEIPKCNSCRKKNTDFLALILFGHVRRSASV